MIFTSVTYKYKYFYYCNLWFQLDELIMTFVCLIYLLRMLLFNNVERQRLKTKKKIKLNKFIKIKQIRSSILTVKLAIVKSV